MTDPITQFIVGNLTEAAGAVIMPLMLLTFGLGCFIRVLIYYVARVESRFAQEFEKRVRLFFATPDAPKVSSFYRLTRILLEKTYLECFEVRNKYKRRNLDHISSIADRLFLTQEGSKRLVDDSLRNIQYLRRDGMPPKMIEVAKAAYENNPYFNRLFGVLPVGMLHELLLILPGLFLIGGILGTFLGISRGLPELGMMDIGNVETTKKTMDMFLGTISQAMVKSILGIGLSAMMTVMNTVFSAEEIYYNLVNRYAGALEYLWNETKTNEVDATTKPQELPRAA